MTSYDQGVAHLLSEFQWNPWFLNTYWPENEPRIRQVAGLAEQLLPPSRREVLDVGCGNGYVTYLFHLLGFRMTAVDASEDEKRVELFHKGGIRYLPTNLNRVPPLIEFPAESFDLVLLGEVFEHILNQPAGLLRSIYRLLRPEGLLILTTPNPSTLANAIRLLGDRYVLWGTHEFLRETKVDEGRVIDRGEIHYREYPAWQLRDLLLEVGFEAGPIRYVRAGIAPTQSRTKRCLKRLLLLTGFANTRLFSPGYVIWARKQPGQA